MPDRKMPDGRDRVDKVSGQSKARHGDGRIAEVEVANAFEEVHHELAATRARATDLGAVLVLVKVFVVERRGIREPTGQGFEKLLEREVDAQRLDLADRDHALVKALCLAEQGLERATDWRCRATRLPCPGVTESPHSLPKGPPARNTLAELWGLAAGLVSLPRLLALSPPAPDSARSVLVVPGFLTDDGATLPMRLVLASRGHRAYGWGLGRNLGDLRSTVPRAVERLSEVAREAERFTVDGRVDLVGWSLGGVIARELARLSPHLVRQVITLGTPIVGGPKYTVAAARFSRRGLDLDAIELEVARRNQTPLPVPSTSIFSRRDNIVAWQASIDPNPASAVEHVEADTTHMGLGVDAAVLEIVLARLERS